MVSAIETEQDRRWAESKIKTLTGGDRIPARFMKQDFFEYTPKFKLIIAGNHKPGLKSVDEAIRRRFNLIPFSVTIPEIERDKELTTSLRSEWPGILQWMLAGCLEWQQMGGLHPPDAVRAATADYLEAEDTLSAWIHECCEELTDAMEGCSVLYRSWHEWSTRTGEAGISQKKFSERLESKGYEKIRAAAGQRFRGLKLRPSVESEREPWYGQ